MLMGYSGNGPYISLSNTKIKSSPIYGCRKISQISDSRIWGTYLRKYIAPKTIVSCYSFLKVRGFFYLKLDIKDHYATCYLLWEKAYQGRSV